MCLYFQIAYNFTTNTSKCDNFARYIITIMMLHTYCIKISHQPVVILYITLSPTRTFNLLHFRPNDFLYIFNRLHWYNNNCSLNSSYVRVLTFYLKTSHKWESLSSFSLDARFVTKLKCWRKGHFRIGTFYTFYSCTSSSFSKRRSKDCN